MARLLAPCGLSIPLLGLFLVLATFSVTDQIPRTQFKQTEAEALHSLPVQPEVRHLYRSRSLLSTTTDSPELAALRASTDAFYSHISQLATIANVTQLFQSTGNDITTFSRTNLDQAASIITELDNYCTNPTSGATNITLTLDVIAMATKVISTLELLGGVILRLMTSTRLFVSDTGSGTLQLQVVKERSITFEGMVFETTHSQLPVYVSVPKSAARTEMAGMVAFAIPAAMRFLYGGENNGKVAAPVVVCSMLDSVGRTLEVATLQPSVTFNVGHGGQYPDQNLQEIVACSYMQTTGATFNGWSSESCELVSESSTEYTCQCHHLSTFTVIYKRQAEEQRLTYVMWTSCAFTFMAAIITTMTMIGYGLLDSERSFVRLNFLISLCLSESVLVAGLRYTDVPGVCYIVAGTLHVCCLASCFWLFSYILLLGTEMRMTNVNRRVMTSGMYTVIGWFVPVCVVCLTIIWRYTSYRDDDYCWISSTYLVQLSFFIPIACCFIVSWVILIYVMLLYNKTRKDPTKLTLVAVTWSGIRSCTLLSFLLLGTWMTASFAIRYRYMWLQAVFTILNILLGLTVFFSMCFLNEEIRLARSQRKVGPSKRAGARSPLAPKTIETETFLNAGCETGKCIHNSSCFYGQAGFSQWPAAMPPQPAVAAPLACGEDLEMDGKEMEARSTPVTEADVPKQRLSKSPPKLLGLVSKAKKSPAKEDKTPPTRTESTAHLLPDVEVHRETEA